MFLQIMFCFGTMVFLLFFGTSCNSGSSGEVVVYSSVDRLYAIQVANTFEKKSGIKVRLVTDTEETKSTGLLNRILAEQSRPQADVFWSGDPMRCAVLKSHEITAAYRSSAATGLPVNFSDSDVQVATAEFGLGWSVCDTVALIRTETGNEVKDYKPGNIYLHYFRGGLCGRKNWGTVIAPPILACASESPYKFVNLRLGDV